MTKHPQYFNGQYSRVMHDGDVYMSFVDEGQFLSSNDYVYRAFGSTDISGESSSWIDWWQVERHSRIDLYERRG